MNRKGVKENGSECEDSSQSMINRLCRQLSNSRRELELSEQICNVLETIRKTSNIVKDVSNRLLYDIADLNDKQLEELHRKENESKAELKKLEHRLLMLRQIQHNNCSLNIQFIKYKKTINNTLVINNKEVLIEGQDYEVKLIQEDADTDTDTDTNTESNADTHSTVAESDLSFDSRDSLLNDIKRKAVTFGGRKRVIPERFESFPQKKRLNGMP